MVENLISEREEVNKSAISEVSAKWGAGQTITGPYISIPFNVYYNDHYKDGTIERKFIRTDWFYYLPDELNINGTANPEKRYRGIHEVVVYQSLLNISGVFKAPKIAESSDSLIEIQYNKATLNLGISDLKGIEKQISVNWNNNEIFFNSGTSTHDIVENGINTRVPITINDSIFYGFSLNLNLKGSQHLYFIPLGKTTDVNLISDWTTPSFSGTYLPDKRTIKKTGFSANWNILHLNRNYPQSWTGSEFKVDSSSFGTDFLLPIDNYKKSYRVARYAILFIILTYLVFFFVEVLNKVFIHPVQYLLVGLALVVFYTLLLSFSEHIVFDYAYWLATVLTLLAITGYTSSILKSKKIGGMILGILAIMYTFIFVIIQMEDYALLIGSIGMFLILSIVMYLSRRIDWYNIKIGNN
jgi:inner membrane protein